VQGIWHLPGNIKGWSNDMRNAPSRGGGGNIPHPSPSTTEVAPTVTDFPTQEPSPTGTGAPTAETGGTGHGGLNPDGTRVSGSGAEHTPQGSDASSPDLQPKSAPELDNPLEDSGEGSLVDSGGDQLSEEVTTGETTNELPDISLNEGPYSIFDQMGVPRGQWEALYNNENLMNELIKNGDAYALTEQGHGFGWAHAGVMKPASVEAIYKYAGITR